jgi:uncharacterized membrane protein
LESLYTNPLANLHILLAQPARFISLPERLLESSGQMLCVEMIGVLGLLDLIFPPRVYLAWSVALVVALLGLVLADRKDVDLKDVDLKDQATPNAPLQFVYVFLLLGLAVWAVAISLYRSWTPVGGTMIQGVQGRYFLVLLPFLALAVPHWRNSLNISAIVPALPAIALGIYDLGYLPLKIVTFYYVY